MDQLIALPKVDAHAPIKRGRHEAQERATAMRKRGRIDGNQVAIVRELRQMGYSVLSISDVGNGAPDLVIGAGGKNYMVEVKDGNQPPSKRKLTTDEKIFHVCWQGQIAVAETTEDIRKIIEAHQ